jgi:Tfp pilus assembly protein FimT
MDVQKPAQSSDASGVSLVGLLMVIVVLGALSATAMVGVSTLTGTGNGTSGRRSAAEAAAALAAASAANASAGSGMSSSARSSCSASADAARSASTLYFASNGGRYPVKWPEMTTSNPPIYKPAADVVINHANPNELDGRGWKLIMAGGGVTAPTFTCR